MPQDKGSSNTGASTAMTDFGPGGSTTIESTTRSSEIVTNASEDAVPDYQTAANTISFKQGRTISKQSLPGEGFTVNPFPIPLAFFDSSSVVPATEENAAAMQRIKSDFVNATSGASSNPADPGFADRWLQFQPTADERFYAIFGVEAFNALTIMEARERGHF